MFPVAMYHKRESVELNTGHFSSYNTVAAKHSVPGCCHVDTSHGATPASFINPKRPSVGPSTTAEEVSLHFPVLFVSRPRKFEANPDLTDFGQLLKSQGFLPSCTGLATSLALDTCTVCASPAPVQSAMKRTALICVLGTLGSAGLSDNHPCLC